MASEGTPDEPDEPDWGPEEPDWGPDEPDWGPDEPDWGPDEPTTDGPDEPNWGPEAEPDEPRAEVVARWWFVVEAVVEQQRLQLFKMPRVISLMVETDSVPDFVANSRWFKDLIMAKKWTKMDLVKNHDGEDDQTRVSQVGWRR